jgi:hypothetical protein
MCRIAEVRDLLALGPRCDAVAMVRIMLTATAREPGLTGPFGSGGVSAEAAQPAVRSWFLCRLQARVPVNL